MSVKDDPRARANTFATVVGESAASVLSQVAGAPWTAAATPAEDESRSPILVRFQATDSLRGEFAFLLDLRDAAKLSKLFVGEDWTNAPTEMSSDDAEAVDELLRQIAGTAATALRPHFGKLELHFAGHDVPNWNVEDRWTIELQSSGHVIRLHLQLSTELVSPIPPEPEHTSHELLPTPALAPASASHEKKPANTGDLVRNLLNDGNLDLLLDIELGVTLRFGRREMLMKDILELSTGSVIELDRMVTEPVDLLVDRKIIARGEVVIVEGNYGLRVTEVTTPQQRIDCLQ